MSLCVDIEGLKLKGGRGDFLLPVVQDSLPFLLLHHVSRVMARQSYQSWVPRGILIKSTTFILVCVLYCSAPLKMMSVHCKSILNKKSFAQHIVLTRAINLWFCWNVSLVQIVCIVAVD